MDNTSCRAGSGSREINRQVLPPGPHDVTPDLAPFDWRGLCSGAPAMIWACRLPISGAEAREMIVTDQDVVAGLI